MCDQSTACSPRWHNGSGTWHRKSFFSKQCYCGFISDINIYFDSFLISISKLNVHIYIYDQFSQRNSSLISLWFWVVCTPLPAGQLASKHHWGRYVSVDRSCGCIHWHIVACLRDLMMKGFKFSRTMWITGIWFTVFHLCLSYWPPLWLISARY